jgi:protein-S-isoprenylcysteine O-methyltransferase Ste14
VERVLLINLLTIASFLLEAYWVLSDPRPRSARVKSYFQPKIIFYSIFAILFFSLNYASGMYFPLPVTGFDQIASMVGVLIFVTGIFLSVWAKVTMGKIWGIPSEMRKDQNKLIKTGPFHYTRNPIYVGLIMVLVGYGLALQSYFTFLALLPILYFWKAAEKEEQLLEKHFKEEYLKYKKQVPRFF